MSGTFKHTVDFQSAYKNNTFVFRFLKNYEYSNIHNLNSTRIVVFLYSCGNLQINNTCSNERNKCAQIQTSNLRQNIIK